MSAGDWISIGTAIVTAYLGAYAGYRWERRGKAKRRNGC